ncbi:MAG TPA: 50S ribosomal protein L6 [Armatimonadetes bacterium]|nr:50S ribosomal protein L6 [Armatimonadota bacterium]
MSRVGKSPIPLAKGVTVTVDGSTVKVKGPLGELERTLPGEMTVTVEDGVVNVARADESREQRSLHGLARALVANMVTGVTEGHKRALLVTGIGYRCEQVGRFVSINCGLSHPVLVRPEPGVEIKAESANRIVVTGADKEVVGDVAARIRAVRPVRPYVFRGDFQGIRYEEEQPRRKAGKQGV